MLSLREIYTLPGKQYFVKEITRQLSNVCSSETTDQQTIEVTIATDSEEEAVWMTRILECLPYVHHVASEKPFATSRLSHE